MQSSAGTFFGESKGGPRRGDRAEDCGSLWSASSLNPQIPSSIIISKICGKVNSGFGEFRSGCSRYKPSAGWRRRACCGHEGLETFRTIGRATCAVGHDAGISIGRGQVAKHHSCLFTEDALGVEIHEDAEYVAGLSQIPAFVFRLCFGIFPEADLQESEFIQRADTAVGVCKPLAEGLEFGGFLLGIIYEHDPGEHDVVHERIGLSLANFGEQCVEFVGVLATVGIKQDESGESILYGGVFSAILLADEYDKLI